MGEYVTASLELHLFFLRIMKEHSLFLEGGLLAKNEEYIRRADGLREQFERMLGEVVAVSDGMVGADVLNSGEIVTEFTLAAEEKTSELTGLPIDTRITMLEMELRSGDTRRMDEMNRRIDEFNRRALRLVNELIALKEELLAGMVSCMLFTFNYPLLIQHILREAELYRSYVLELLQTGRIHKENQKQVEMFWNRIMMEHALFIRGLLDPTEEQLIDTADRYAHRYGDLLEAARAASDRTATGMTGETVQTTEEYRDFKAAGTEGVIECKIQAIFVPLLADHVLREANHYLRLLS